MRKFYFLAAISIDGIPALSITCIHPHYHYFLGKDLSLGIDLPDCNGINARLTFLNKLHSILF